MSNSGQNLPRWLLIAAVLGSGLLTGWAMWQTRAAGPQSSWDRVDTAVAEIWAQPTPAQGGPMMGGPMAAQPMPGAQMPVDPFAPAQMPVDPFAPAQTVAGAPMTAAAAAAQTSMVARVRGAPPILWGANRPHGDRGSCTNCHSILRQSGRPVPMILSSSSMPHGFRGICSNCHTVMGDGPVGPLPVAMPVGPGAGPQMMGAQPAGAQPQEVEWRGLETRPGPQGVTVNNVDGTARRAGVMPGDVIVSLNGAPVGSMAQLEALTMNGNLAQGTVIVRRNGQRMAFELRQAPGVGIAAPPNPGGGFAAQPGPMPMQLQQQPMQLQQQPMQLQQPMAGT